MRMEPLSSHKPIQTAEPQSQEEEEEIERREVF